MGPCQAKLKQKTIGDQPRSQTTRKTDQVFPANNPSLVIQTDTPNFEVINYLCDELKQHWSKIKKNQCSYTKKPEMQVAQFNIQVFNHQKIVQNNLTGKIRIIETCERNIINEQFIIQTKSLDHPKIVTVHEIFITEESFYLVLDYCSGGYLSHYCSNKSLIPFSEPDIASIIYQCGEVLQYLKKTGKTHGHLTLNSFSRVDTSLDFLIKFSDIRGLYVKHQINDINIYTLASQVCNSSDIQVYPSSTDLQSLGIQLIK